MGEEATEEIDHVEQKSLPPPHSKKLKVLTTAAIYFGNVALGYVVNAIPPAIEDIRLKYVTTIDQLSIAFTIQAVLYLVGAILYGFVTKYVRRQIVVLVALGGMAFTMYMIPYCPTELAFFIVVGVLGCSCGLYDSLQVVWVIEIWQEKAGPFIVAQHLAFAIGSNIPSVLIAPFLTSKDGTESRIYIPYAILGAITTVALLFQLLLFTFCRYYTPPMYVSENSNEISDNPNEQNGQQPLEEYNVIHSTQSILGFNKTKVQLIAVTGIFMGAYQGMEVSTLQFIPIFGQYSDLQMSQSAAAYVLAALIGMFAIGRAIGILLILKVRPEVLLFMNCGIIAIGNLILLIWANDNLTLFWVGCIIVGAGYSTMYPSFCAFMEKYLVFTNAIGSFICVVGSIFTATYPLIVGRFIERDAVVLTYSNFFSTAACLVAIVWGCLLARTVKIRV